MLTASRRLNKLNMCILYRILRLSRDWCVHNVWSAAVEAGSESSAVCSWHVGGRTKQQWSTSLAASFSRRPALKNWL